MTISRFLACVAIAGVQAGLLYLLAAEAHWTDAGLWALLYYSVWKAIGYAGFLASDGLGELRAIRLALEEFQISK